MENVITETNTIRMLADYDVVVVGGGIAGISAALAAKRNDCKVLIIEKSVMPGGLATLGLVAIYLPLCNGRGKKVTGGIAEELLHLSIKYGYGNLGAKWTKDSNTSFDMGRGRYRTIFSPHEFVVALDELFEAEGIDILYDTLFCKPVMSNGLCEGVIVENKSGRAAYRTKTVIDASGDADVFYRAGADCVETDNWLSYWAYTTNLESMKKAVESKDIKKGIRLEHFGANNEGKNNDTAFGKSYGTDAVDISRFITRGRRMMKEALIKKGYFKPDHKKAVIALPAMAQFRTTRRISGIYEINDTDVNRDFDDSIGCAGDWRKAGPVYQIPYRSLINPGFENIIAAGRIIASSGDAWEVTRVIPAAALTGQAAGTAAALAIKEKCGFSDMPVNLLQKVLEDNGVIIHI